MQVTDTAVRVVPPRSRKWPSIASISIVAAIILSVAAVALVDGRTSAVRALGIGIGAALVWTTLDGLAPFGRRRARSAVSPQALGAVAIVLCVSWNVTGFGLEPIDAVAAVALAALASVLALATLRRTGFHPHAERVLVVGSGVVADALVAALEREGRSEVLGRIDDGPDPELIGDLDAFEAVAGHRGATAVIFAYSHAPDGRLAELAERCRELDLAVAVVPRLFEQFDRRLRTRQVAGMPLLIVDPLPYQAQLPVLARVLDVVAATVLLILSAPLWVVIGLLIFVEEPGAIFFCADRIGLGGRQFKMFKFRKMRLDATGPKLTVASDPRFTRIGRLLARTKFDELPQLLNVLRGEMGLVGPRPEDPSYVALFPDEFGEILRVRPGITGLSQIQYRDESALLVGNDFDELYRNELLPSKIGLDRYYARHRCLALDLRILVWTVVAVVAGARVDRNELTRAVRFEKLEAPVEVESENSDWAAA